MQCGLLGRKLTHSYSPEIHRCFGSYQYKLFETEPEALSKFFKTADFHGLNVTIPYKKEVLRYCNRLSESAASLGAVNTIVREKNGELVGYNTDYFGFSALVQHSGLSPSGKKALVLGSGGASNTAAAVLEAMGATVVIISRSGPNHYGNLFLHADAAIIVNATPVGMYPSPGVSPVNLADFPHLEGVLDMIYNPSYTKLLLDAKNRGLVAENGLWMLVAQAKQSAELFMNTQISDDMIAAVYQNMQRQMKNIILIGMPGCGKTYVGKALSEILGRKFADSDAALVGQVGFSVTDIFKKEGESGFRIRETGILSELGKQSGLVLATGGGCVTQKCNYDLLHQNGIIFWLTRDIRKLETTGRPLSQSGKLVELWKTREPMYRRFADHIISNNGNLNETITQIINTLEASK